MKQTRHTNCNKQQGIATVEFAVVLPFLILMLAATADVGYLMYHQNILNKSVASGGRFISTHATDGSGLVNITAQKIQETRNMIVYGNIAGFGDPVISGFSPSDINITCSNGTRNGYCIQDAGLTPITLQATYTYSPVLGTLFDNVTGLNLFPLPMSATTIVESI